MAESLKIVAEKREKVGSNAARKLRKNGRLPVVIYGHKEASVPVSIPVEEFQKAMRHHIRYIDLETNGQVEKTLIRDVQWDYLGIDVLHVDLVRVAKGERVQVEVEITTTGDPVGVAHGGVLEQPHHTVPVECPALEIPDAFDVNIENLELGGAIHVKDLTFPPGVTPLLDAEEVVMHITEGTQAPELEEEAAPAAEPEVIGEEQKEEEGPEEEGGE